MTNKAAHKTKVKTTKELTEEIKAVKETNEYLKDKIKELELKLKKVVSKVKGQHNLYNCEQEKERNIKCAECDEVCQTKAVLKKHKREKHRRKISCAECGETFIEHWILEIHLKNHDKVANFPCDICKKVFQVRWRLTKHLNIHEDENTKKCHFYNNGKPCPFEEVGCKFLHEESDRCIYNKSCNNRLFQFRHGEDEDLLCKKCNFFYKSSGDLNIHMQSIHGSLGDSSHLKCESC